MPKFTLTFPQTRVDLTTIDNIVFVQVFGVYNDEIVLRVLERLDPLLDAIPSNPIRVWDASGIPANAFNLTPACMEQISLWAQDVQVRRPDSMAYLIGFSPVSYGMGRMHAMKSELETKGMEVLKRFDELPPEIRAKLSP